MKPHLGNFQITFLHANTMEVQICICRYTVEDENELCDLSLNATDVCEDNIDSTLRKYTYMLYVGQLLVGVGATPLFTLGWLLLRCIVQLQKLMRIRIPAVLRGT